MTEIAARAAKNAAFSAATDRAIAKGLRTRAQIEAYVDADPAVIATREAHRAASAAEEAAIRAGQPTHTATAGEIARAYGPGHDVAPATAHTEEEE